MCDRTTNQNAREHRTPASSNKPAPPLWISEIEKDLGYKIDMAHRLEDGRLLLDELYFADKYDETHLLYSSSLNLYRVNLFNKSVKSLCLLKDAEERQRLLSCDDSERTKVNQNVLFADAAVHTLFDVSNYKVIERYLGDAQLKIVKPAREAREELFVKTLPEKERNATAGLLKSDRMLFLRLFRKRVRLTQGLANSGLAKYEDNLFVLSDTADGTDYEHPLLSYLLFLILGAYTDSGGKKTFHLGDSLVQIPALLRLAAYAKLMQQPDARTLSKEAAAKYVFDQLFDGTTRPFVAFRTSEPRIPMTWSNRQNVMGAVADEWDALQRNRNSPTWRADEKRCEDHGMARQQKYLSGSGKTRQHR